MGMSNEERRFWKVIFGIKGIEFPKSPDSESIERALRVQSEVAADVAKRIIYSQLSNKTNSILLRELLMALAISIDNYPDLQAMIDFRNYHLENLNAAHIRSEQLFRCLLWKSLVTKKKEQEDFLDRGFAYFDLFEPFCKKALEPYRWRFDCRYDELLDDFISKNFQFKLDVVSCKNKYDSIFLHNCKITGLIDANLSREDRSLLCFEGNNDVVLSRYPSQAKAEPDEDRGENSTPSEFNVTTVTITSSGVAPFSNHHANPSGGGAYHPSTEAANRKAGKSAELLVYQYLVHCHGKEKITWVSGNSATAAANDAFGYDIRYVDPMDTIRYVEVKRSSGEYFYLSQNEMKFGLAHKDNFEIALVVGTEIRFVKDFFLFENPLEEFQSNTKFVAEPREYLVRFKFGGAAK